MAAKKTKSPGDMLSEVFHRAIEIMSDLSTATAAASVNASLTSTRHLAKFQKNSTKAGLKLVSKVQDYTDKSLREAMKNGKWLPEEGKDVVDEWAKMMGAGINEFGRVVDKSFDLVLKYLDRVEKEAKVKAPEKKKYNPKTTTTKKAVAGKKAVAKKSAAKPAVRKTPTKKKSTGAAK